MELKKLLKNRLLLLTTGLPTLLAAVYFGVVASDTFVSESRFVVVDPEQQTASPFGMMLKGTGFAKTQDNAYVVQNYILSRDALHSLDAKFDLQHRYDSPRIDRISRFAGIDLDHSFEALYRYYLKHIEVKLDSSSSIMTLTVRAHSAADASAINAYLLTMSEQLVNRLNERARSDLINAAANDVIEAQKKDDESALALAAYRNAQQVIDPEKQAALQIQQISKLNEELLDTRIQIQQLTSLAKDSPQLPVLRGRAALLEQEASLETRHMAGAAESSLATKAADFQRLIQRKEFTTKMLASAMNSLEQARAEARRKQLYVSLIVSPSTPDMAIEPKRLRNVGVTFLLGLMLFGILSMLIAGIREHQD